MHPALGDPVQYHQPLSSDFVEQIAPVWYQISVEVVVTPEARAVNVILVKPKVRVFTSGVIV